MSYKHLARRGFLPFWFVGLLVLVSAGLLAAGSSEQNAHLFQTSSGVARAAPFDTSTPTSGPTSTPTCLPGWFPVSNPPESSGTLTIESIAVLSATDIWAVGHQLHSDYPRTYEITLAEHWDGT